MHSNWFFALSVTVFALWAYALWPGQVLLVDCPYRVSARGIVHGPESPFWGLTSRDPCFHNRDAARVYARGIE